MENKPAMRLGGQGGRQSPGLHSEECCQMVEGGESWGCEMGLLSVEKRRLRGHPIKVYNCLEGECKEDGPGLLPLVPSDKRQWAPTET